MSDSFQSPTGIQWNSEGTYGQVQFGDDKNIIAAFYMKSVRNDAKSIEENRPIFENVVYIKIQHPGERLNQIDRPATNADKTRFERQWRSFMMNKTQIPEGTPIELLFPANPAYADTLKAMGIYTIEQGSNLSADGITNIGMHGQDLVNKCKKYLKEASSSQAYNHLRQDLEKKDQQIKILERSISELKAQNDELFKRIGNTMAPTNSMLNPQELRSYDPQTERINANHKTGELKKKRAPSIPDLPNDVREQLDLNTKRLS